MHSLYDLIESAKCGYYTEMLKSCAASPQSPAAAPRVSDDQSIQPPASGSSDDTLTRSLPRTHNHPSVQYNNEDASVASPPTLTLTPLSGALAQPRTGEKEEQFGAKKGG